MNQPKLYFNNNYTKKKFVHIKNVGYIDSSQSYRQNDLFNIQKNSWNDFS